MSQVPAQSCGPMTRRFVPVDGIVEHFVDGELVLYDSYRQRVHALNGTAAFIWVRCDGKHDEDRIVADLARLYPDQRHAIAWDVLDAIGTLLEESLIELVGV